MDKRSERLNAIVLSRKDHYESDRQLTLFSPGKGKFHAFARGVRLTTSKKAGHLEPFTVINVQILERNSFLEIGQVETAKFFPLINRNLATFGKASFMTELVDIVSFDAEKSAAIFSLLVAAIARLDQINDKQDTVIHYFLISLFDLIGFRPELTNCVFCGNDIQPVDQYFSPDNGGAVCPACKNEENLFAKAISMNTLRYMRHLQRSTFDYALESNFNDHVIEDAFRHLVDFMNHYLGRTPKSLAFLSV